MSYNEARQELMRVLQSAPEFLGDEKDIESGAATVVELHALKVPILPHKAEKCRDVVVSWCEAYPDQDKIRGEVSYIEMGVILGDQQDAFVLFALGEVLGLWRCLTPKRMGILEPLASEMAGRGMITISGYMAGQSTG